MFQLDQAIKKWNEQFKTNFVYAQSDLLELKDHLINEIDNLTNSGLSEEEAFFIATNRIGDKEKLNKEFSKVNYNNIWKYRLLWMAVGIVLLYVFNNISFLISNLLSVNAVLFGLDSYIGIFHLFGRVISLIVISFIIYLGILKGNFFENNYIDRIKKIKFGKSILLVSSLVLIFVLKISSYLSLTLMTLFITPESLLNFSKFTHSFYLALGTIFYILVIFFIWKQTISDHQLVE